MLNQPNNCPHDLIGKTATKQELCLKCMTKLKDLKQSATLSINVHEDVKMKDVGPGQN